MDAQTFGGADEIKPRVNCFRKFLQPDSFSKVDNSIVGENSWRAETGDDNLDESNVDLTLQRSEGLHSEVHRDQD